MDTLTSLRVFREVVEAGSFAKAAKRLDLSTAMASKHVAHLERSLGARLLNRTSRHLSLTEAGSVYQEHCREALDTLDAAAAALSQGQAEPRGVLKVTAPVWFATQRVAEVLARYRLKHPQVVVDIHLENRRVDLVQEGYDLALRATVTPAPSLIARRIASVRFLLVASPAYLTRAGRLKVPADLSGHELILPTYISMDSVALEGPSGEVRVKVRAAMKSSDTTLTHHAVRAGLGLALLPEWLVGEDVAARRLVHVLPSFSFPLVPIYAAYTSRKYLSSKVRSFIDFFTEALGQG